MREFFKYFIYVSIATLWVALFVVLPDFLDNPIEGFWGIITIATYVLAVSVISFLIVYLLSINKYAAAVFLPLYYMFGAAVSYYRVKFRVTITPLILDCILNTNVEEASGVITWSFIFWILLNIGVGICLVLWRWRIESPQRIWLHVLCVIILFVGYYYGNNRLRRSINQRYPMHIVESIRQYVWLQDQRNNPHVLPNYEVNELVDSLDIIVVIGESVRADHLSINGYERPTTPLLEQRSNVVSFPYVYTEQTHTLASVPILLTRADTLHPQHQYNETSFAAILRNEDFHTAWISNQDLGNTFAAFPSECDTMIWANAGKSVFVFSGWYDEELLSDMDEQLSIGYPKNLLVFHTIGSHWYYNNHVPANQHYFLPITTNRVVTNNSIEQIVNSYDNTIRYTDFVLDSMIQRLENRCAVMIYISDHGESLGEHGNWLHATGAKETKNPACIVWYSNSFAERYPNKVSCLNLNSKLRYRTDFLFHSILSLADLSAVGEDQIVMDVFR